MKKVTRKLTTILAADCAGYSELMDKNEELTLENLKICRSIIDPIIEEYGGRIFNTAGDSVVAEFSSTVESVNAGIIIQKTLFDRNKKSDSISQLVWRIGIHLDDVIIEGDNIYGTGVNIAARLEGECKPGEILVSRMVSEQVRKRIGFAVNAEGKKSLKNISEPVEVFSITPETSENLEEKIEINKVTTNLKAKAEVPKIALVPFSNLNNDEESGYLVDGIVEDLITEFSMIKELEVLSRQSSFEFRESNQDIGKFSKKFGLNFIVSGSVRTSGKRVRLSIQLNDPTIDKIIWSNRYDRILEDVFDLQDEIVQTVTIALVGEIEITSLNRAKRKPTENISSYEFLLRGKELHHKFEKNANHDALDMFDKAIEADPNNAQAYAWKACTVAQAMARNYSDKDAETLLQEAMKLVKNAHELNENDFECHRMMSAVFLSQHNYRLAEEHGRKSYDINPNDPRVVSGYGEVLVRVGKFDEGIAHLQKAYELDPVPQGQTNSDKRLSDLVLGYFMKSDFENCIETGDSMQTLDTRSWIFRSFSLDKIGEFGGQLEEAKKWKVSQNIDDWAGAIDRFHIPDEKRVEDIRQFIESI
ncbi:MAG: adenylate/guanylate cyclase domain-containing protein [Alphaproteobacteria bacterium]